MLVTRSRVASVAAVALVATIFPALGSGGAQAASTAELFGPAPDGAQAPPGTALAERSRLVSLDPSALTRAGAGDRFELNLFDDASFGAYVTEVERRSGSTSWSGRIDAVGSEAPGIFHAVRVEDTFHLEIGAAGDSYTVSRVDGSTYRVVEKGVRSLPEETDAVVSEAAEEAAEGATNTGSAPRAGSAAATGGDDGSIVDILVAYTARAASENGGEAGIKAMIQTGIDQSNLAHANSGITTRLRLVGTMQTNGPDSGSQATDFDLGRVADPADGVFDDIPPVRDALHADLVNVYFGGTVAPFTGCGWGYYSTVPTPNAEDGYSVQQAACATGTGDYVFSHEVGHNFGADHDANAGSVGAYTAPYARGFVDYGLTGSAKRITIMSYFNTCNCGDRELYFSNPNVLFPADQRPMGSALANNARVINESAVAVANYRASQIYPGVPAISGKATVGKTVTADPGAWAGATAFGYQWLANGAPISGATGSTLKLTNAQAGKTLTVQVTGSGTNYTPVTATSPAGVKVANAGIVFKRPRLFGTARVGNMVGVKVSSKVKNVSFKFVWYRNNKKIKGVRGPLYRLKAADRGTKIHVKVTAKKKGYSSTSQKTKKIRVR